jgi:tetratricopeptide (TPR) repeat protein
MISHENKGTTGDFGPFKMADPMQEAFRKLQQAEALRRAGKAGQAATICEGLVRQYPDYFGALYTLGLAYIAQQRHPQALGCLVRAAMLNPRSWRALTALSAVYLELGATEMAANTLEQATAINPNDPSILITLGEIYREDREYELAQAAYQKSFELDRTLDAAALGLGSCCMQLGQYAQAAEILEGLLRRGVRSTGIYTELNNLPASFVSVDVLSSLDKIEQQPGQDTADFETSVAFISAAALHSAGRHEEAWNRLVAANRRILKTRESDAAALANTQRANLAQLKNKPTKIQGKGGDGTRAISLFILGPSRSGKTTMETLVASLDGVKRGYENPAVENAIRRTFQSAGLLATSMFEVLPPKLDADCRDLYLEELSRRAGSAKVFTNTHPGRIHDAARVAAAIPGARFIFVKRNLEDNMLRIFMWKYLTGNSYAYDLKTVRDHIIWYHQMIDTLADKLPDITRVVHYEDMVADPAATRAAIGDFCGLELNDRPIPPLGDDRGCAEPYRQFMAGVL